MFLLLSVRTINSLIRFNIFKQFSYNTRSINVSKSTLFAGHSKWANIRHVKAAKDEEKAVLFGKLSRQIRFALQEGGNPDPTLNTQLKSAIEEALRKNMPMATVNTIIKQFKQNKKELRRYRIDLRYKQKVFMVCVIYTDNFPAVKMDITPILRKSRVTKIEANNIFEEVGLIEAYMEKTTGNENCDFAEKVVEDAISFGAEDVEIIDKDLRLIYFVCKPFEVMSLKKTIESNGYLVDNMKCIYTPAMRIELNNEEMREYKKFVVKIKNVPGVEEIYDNLEEEN